MLAGDRAKPRQMRAIVLIDEVELHLHPTWQRKILPWLLKAFPHCQFVVTTHSPQVIGDIKAEYIRVLDFKPKGNRVQSVTATKGRDSNFLLLSVFGAEERSATTKKRFDAFEKAFRNNDHAAASQELERLAAEIEGGAPELTVARSRLERRKTSS
jgi:predicted ATP-binding protein involved in virulence